MAILQRLKGSFNTKALQPQTHSDCNFFYFNGWLKTLRAAFLYCACFTVPSAAPHLYVKPLWDHRLCNSQPPQLPTQADIGAFSLILLKDTVSWPQVWLENRKIVSTRFSLPPKGPTCQQVSCPYSAIQGYLQNPTVNHYHLTIWYSHNLPIYTDSSKFLPIITLVMSEKKNGHRTRHLFPIGYLLIP